MYLGLGYWDVTVQRNAKQEFGHYEKWCFVTKSVGLSVPEMLQYCTFFFFLNVPAWCIDLQATSVAIWTFLWMKKHKLLQTLFPKTANKNTFCFHVLQQKCSLDLDTKDFVNTFFWKAYSSDWSALWFHENEISVVYKQNYSIFFSESLEFSPLVST